MSAASAASARFLSTWVAAMSYALGGVYLLCPLTRNFVRNAFSVLYGLIFSVFTVGTVITHFYMKIPFPKVIFVDIFVHFLPFCLAYNLKSNYTFSYIILCYCCIWLLYLNFYDPIKVYTNTPWIILYVIHPMVALGAHYFCR